jgi:hypothetical protein
MPVSGDKRIAVMAKGSAIHAAICRLSQKISHPAWLHRRRTATIRLSFLQRGTKLCEFAGLQKSFACAGARSISEE